MSTRRTAKVAEAIREVVSSTILFELRDPRVANVTVLHAEVPSDLRTARVYISIMGDEAAQRLCLHGINSARGFIQSQIAEKLDLRYTPVLTFVVDDGIKKSIEASRILRELADREGPLHPDEGDDAGDPDDSGPSAEAAEESSPADPASGERQRHAPGD
jgi:ribosome-binding factor A